MIKQLLAGVVVAGLMSGIALAQTYPYPPAPPPPPGTTVMPAVPPAPVPVPVPVPGTSTTTTTVVPNPDADHREVDVHKEVDRKGNTVIEKDIHREGISGSTETHKKIETDRDGTVTHSETTTKHD
jgi:hypothetical protein